MRQPQPLDVEHALDDPFADALADCMRALHPPDANPDAEDSPEERAWMGQDRYGAYRRRAGEERNDL